MACQGISCVTIVDETGRVYHPFEFAQLFAAGKA